MTVLTMQIEQRGNLKTTLKHTITYVDNEALLNSTFISSLGTISSQQISQVRL